MSDPANMFFIVAHMIARLFLTAMAVGILYYYDDRLNWFQRVGVGILGGLSFLTIPVVYDAYTANEGTPFDQWASFGATIGMSMFLWGSFVRIRRHAEHNAQQIIAAQKHLRERGKL